MKWWRSMSLIIVIIHDGPWMSPQHLYLWQCGFWWGSTNVTIYICTNSDDHERSITINRCCSYEMVTITIFHYNQYLWRTFNVTITPILLVTLSFLWRRLWSVTIAHMKWWRSLSVVINHYWWRTLNVTTTPILLAMPPLVTFSFWWRRLWSVTIAHMKWWQSPSVIINHYWWQTLHVTTKPILLAMPLLVTFSFWWRRLFWLSPMSLWWHFFPVTNVLFSCSDLTFYLGALQCIFWCESLRWS